MTEKMTKTLLAKTIDHTQLKATATAEDIKRLCAEAISYGFASVCINPCFVSLAESLLRGSGVRVCTVVGFPLGACTPFVKEAEAEHAVLQGADEIDMVINVGKAKEGDFAFLTQEIAGVVKATQDAASKCGKTALVKVIIETCYLTDEEKIAACKAAVTAGADFVKTSTGFATPPKAADGSTVANGATVHDVVLMRKTVDEATGNTRRVGVKASGGIRDTKTALEMLGAGGDRLGVSAGVAIIAGFSE